MMKIAFALMLLMLISSSQATMVDVGKVLSGGDMVPSNYKGGPWISDGGKITFGNDLDGYLSYSPSSVALELYAPNVVLNTPELTTTGNFTVKDYGEIQGSLTIWDVLAVDRASINRTLCVGGLVFAKSPVCYNPVFFLTNTTIEPASIGGIYVFIRTSCTKDYYLTLPYANEATGGDITIVNDAVCGSYYLNIVGYSGDKINGLTNIKTQTRYDTLTLMSYGSGWVVKSKSGGWVLS